MSYLAPIRGGLTPAQYYAAANKGLAGKIYNVEDYGAVHDGVTDDTGAIQDAINACFAADGGTVYFPNGTYIIAGTLQNDVGVDAVDYNSQLYIPYSPATGIKQVKLVGESYNWLVTCQVNVDYTGGVILKSTIAGSGTFPSVIASRGAAAGSYWNYTTPFIFGIKIIVNSFYKTTGPSMCGINFMKADNCYLDDVTTTIDCAALDSIEPTAQVFGIAVGLYSSNFPRIGRVQSAGFYYGIVCSEGVMGDMVHCYNNKIGLLVLRNYYGVTIHQAVLHWNAYAIASQTGTINGWEEGQGNLIIDTLCVEDGYDGDDRTPAWCWKVDYILDEDNFIHGEVGYILSAGINTYITKSNGGYNLLIKNLAGISNFHWTTTARPASPGSGCMGFNTTTKKLEYWNESAWVEIPAAT